jgi:hypothetical protein
LLLLGDTLCDCLALFFNFIYESLFSFPRLNWLSLNLLILADSLMHRFCSGISSGSIAYSTFRFLDDLLFICVGSIYEDIFKKFK